ncbi:MAG: CopD family protein, partial [Chitinophagaceae bacterium]|nr:CopD family protein [Chitinophagaceae bacterium]
MFLYIKALHIIFVVTWFAALFYMPRLFIYNTEAQEKTGEAKDALTQQFAKMMKRLWFGIATPSAVLTLILGLTTMYLEFGYK